ncbi:MAG: S8 family serine peptidase, partial [Actinomycetota bacterium]|nr:S8 family serine peptidase [Actinomycetota bacterium]
MTFLRRLLALTSVIGVISGLMGVASGSAPASASGSVVSEAIDVPYIVELDPAAAVVVVKADDPRAPEIARDAVADTVIDSVQQRGDAIAHDYDDLPFLAVETNDPAGLAMLPGVLSVTPDIRVERELASSLPVINAEDRDLDGALGGVRADGSGWAVAVIDDGIDRAHQFFARADGSSRVIAESCRTRGYCPGGTTSTSGTGTAAHHAGDYHGTHVAGIAAGDSRGAVSSVPRGVARSADIVAVQVFNPNGGAYGIDIDAGLQWVLEQKNSGTPIAAVNMSLGGGLYDSDAVCDASRPSTKAIIDQLEAVGVVVVVAAGNSGKTTELSWPGCLSNVVPVGSSTDGDLVSSFSNVNGAVVSRGVMAPGSGVCSSVPTSVLGSGYGCLSGTSMAAPHVAGAVALLRQAAPAASVADVKAALRTTPTQITDTRISPNRTGLLRLDVASALAVFAVPGGQVQGTVTDESVTPTTPLSNSTVTLALTPVGTLNGRTSFTTSVSTDGVGQYNLANLTIGTWDVTASATGYSSTGITSFTVTNGQTTSISSGVRAETGDVTGSITGVSLPADVTFSFDPATGSNWSAYSVTQSVQSDGAFALTDVKVGSWRLTAQAGAAISATVDLTVTNNATVSAGALSLAVPVGSLAGTATNALTGAVLASTTVVVAGTPSGDPTDRVTFSHSVSTSAQGVFSVPGIRLGSWSVTVDADGFDPTSSAVTVAVNQASTVSASLSPEPGDVGGTIVDGAIGGQASPQSGIVEGEATLDFVPSGSIDGRSSTSRTTSFASSGGSYTVFDILPGDWNVTATVFGFSPTTSAVTVQSGQTATDVDFTLERRTALAAVSPTSGSTEGGDTVTVTGLHLTGAMAVTFGGVSGSIVSVASDGRSMVVRSPAKPAGSAAIVVTGPLGASTDTVNFTFVTPTPVVVSPPSGGGGGGGGGGG